MKQEDTKQKILDKALELFSAQGYDSVSVGEIAKAVGIKAPSLYNHFPSKQAIFDAIVESTAARYEADTDKIVSLVDEDCVADNDVETLSSSFELLTSMGVEYSIDYKITSTEKANRATIKNMCEGLYGDTSVASKVRCAYICDVDYTMTINYLGETETEDDKMSLICYKKGGKWYIGGTVENE